MKNLTNFNQSSLRKLKTVVFSALASLLFLASCGDSSEIVDPDPDPDPEPDPIEVIIDATRTDWHSTWVDSDQIGVINSKTTIEPFSFSEGTFFTEGTLTGTDAPEIICAFYPYASGLKYTAVKDEPMLAYQYVVPAEQNVKYNANGSVDMASLRKLSFMCGATASKLASDGTVPIVMHNINATIKLQITDLAPNAPVKSIIVSSETLSPKSSAITISTENGAFTSTPVAPTPTRTDEDNSVIKTITINIDGAKVSDDGSLDVFLSVLPQTIAAETKLGVKIMGETEQMGETAYAPVVHTAYEAGKSYDVPVAVISYDRHEITLNGTKTLAQALTDLNQDVNTMSHLTLKGAPTHEDLIYTRSFEVLRYLNIVETDLTTIPAYLYSDDTSSKNPFKGTPLAANKTLQEVHLPENITILDGWIFERCKRLTTVYLPENLVEFKASVFEGCEALRVADIPESVTTIGSWCFESTRIPEIVVPAGVTVIGSGTFAGLKEYRGVISVTFMRADPTTCDWKGSATNTFDGLSKEIAIRVPMSGLEKYKVIPELKLWAEQMVGFE